MFVGETLSFSIALFLTSFRTGNSFLHCSTTSSVLSSQTRPYFFCLRKRSTSVTSWSFVQLLYFSVLFCRGDCEAWLIVMTISTLQDECSTKAMVLIVRRLISIIRLTLKGG